MNVRNKICDLLDPGEKGHVTIGDVGVASLCIGAIITAIYLVYCGLPIWQIVISSSCTIDPFIEGDFSFLASLGYAISIVLIAGGIFGLMLIGMRVLEYVSNIVIFIYKRK